MILRLLAIILTWCALGGEVQAQTVVTTPAAVDAAGENLIEGQRFLVATRVLPPFMIKAEQGYIGFSAELWDEISKRLRINFDWKETANVKEILASVESGESQIGLAAISITSAREQKFDFSQPMFESGLQIMVRQQNESQFSWKQITGFFTRGAMPYLLGLLALLILVPGHIAWFVERGHEFPAFSPKYFPGVFQAMAWALGAAAGQQHNHPQSGLGRIMSVAAVFISLLFLTYWQAQLTSSFTIEQLQGGISGPQDLPGQSVGTTTGSTAATWLKEHEAKVSEFQKIDDAYKALENGQIDAVVFDAPVLLFYAANKGRQSVRMVGPIFKKENYGILFPRGFGLRKLVNEELLKMREDGAYDRLYEKWFSVNSSQ